MDEPFSDNAILGTSILAIHAYAHGIRVLAEGEGGDELFGHADLIKNYLSMQKFSHHKFIQKTSYYLSLFPGKLKILSKIVRMNKKQLVRRFSCNAMNEEEFGNIVFGGDENKFIEKGQEHNIISLAYFLTNNIGFEIAKNKLASAVSGCSFIAPYLEVDLLKLALVIPPKIKFKRERAIIKNLYEVELKRKGYDNKKIGMTVPTAQWILNKHKDLLYLGKFYKKLEIDELLKEFESNPSDYLDQKIWRVFVLNKWYELNKNKF